MPSSLRPPACAVLVAAVAALLGPPPAAAEEPPPVILAQAAALPFAIPPGPLAPALVAFGRQAGLQVSFDPTVAAGAASPGVTGTLPPEMALRRLLAGTGTIARFQEGGTVVVERAAQDSNAGGVVLNPITVEAGRGAPSTAAIGEPSPTFAGGQVGRGGRVGLLGNRDLFDTPFSTQSFTEELARNQQAQSPADLLRLDPAASVFYSPSQRGNIAGTIFTLRGFEVNSSQATFNGLPGLLSRSENVLPFERVEVIRGPSALTSPTTGRSTPTTTRCRSCPASPSPTRRTRARSTPSAGASRTRRPSARSWRRSSTSPRTGASASRAAPPTATGSTSSRT